jgi:chloramphenicol O-acetyltransferase
MSYYGKRVRGEDPMHDIESLLLKRRCDSQVFVTLNFPCKPIKNYIVEKRQQGRPVSHMALLIAACVRTVRDYPEFNRFVLNAKLYQHDDLTISMVVIRPGVGNDTNMAVVHFDLDDTVFMVNEKYEKFIEETRRPPEASGMDKVITWAVKLPFVRPLAKVVLWLDRHCMAPKWFLEISPFHASIAVSNLASLKTPWVHHHLYELGTISCFIVMGQEQIIPTMQDGQLVPVKCLPIGMTIDERICSGAYLAKCCDRLRHYMAHPDELE